MAARVMVVDDNEIYRVILRTLLTRQGFDVQTAIGIGHALEVLKTYTPDLFILDVTMGDGNGLDLCERLRQDSRTKSTPVLIYSGNDDLKMRQQSTQAGAQTFVSKSETHVRLLNEVLALLNNRRHPSI